MPTKYTMEEVLDIYHAMDIGTDIAMLQNELRSKFGTKRSAQSLYLKYGHLKHQIISFKERSDSNFAKSFHDLGQYQAYICYIKCELNYSWPKTRSAIKSLKSEGLLKI